jgi:nucleoid-associated protein YgaU
MNKHLAATYVLSVGIVGLCAIALHTVDRPPTRPAPTELTRSNQPPVVPPPARPEKKGPAVPEPALPPVEIVAKPLPRVEPKAEVPASKVVRQVAQTTPKARPAPSTVRGPFTVVEEGETLEDVSLRVYGTTDRATSLWRANRDQTSSRDGVLRAGMTLRTP